MFWLYLTLAGTIALYELCRKRHVLVDWMSLLNIYVLIYYVSVPLVHQYQPDGVSWRTLSLFPEASSSGWVFTAIVLTHASVILGYELGRRHPLASSHLSIRWIDGRIAFAYSAAVILVFGMVSTVAAAGSGGITQAILSASEVRAGRASRGLVAYAEYAFEIAPLALILVFSLRSYSGLKRSLRWPLLTLIFFVVMYLALMAAGRGKLLTPFVLGYLLWVNSAQGNERKRVLPVVTILLVLTVALTVAYGKAAFWELKSLSSGVDVFMDRTVARQSRLLGDASLMTALTSVLGYFDHYLVSVHLAIEHPEAYQAPRMLLDWPRAVVSYSPGLEQPDFVVTGTPSGHGRDVLRSAGMLFVGYVPPGWVAMNYINMLWPGVLMISVISGYLAGIASEIIAEHARNERALMGLYIVLGWIWVMYGFSADPFMAIPLLILLILIFAPILACLRVRCA